MKKYTIIWDFDGTLLPNDPYDSEQSLLNYKLYESEEKISLFLRALTQTLIYADNRERLRKMFKRFYVWFLKGTPVAELDLVSERLAAKIPGADQQVLKNLKAQGHTMMVLSCGTADLSERILNMAGIIDCFDVIEGNRFEIDNDQITGMNLQMMEPEDKVKFLNEMGIVSDATVAVGDGYSDIPLLNWSRVPIIIDRSGNKRKRFSDKEYYFVSSIPNVMKIIEGKLV
jgi:phosphoserine phosphatase